MVAGNGTVEEFGDDVDEAEDEWSAISTFRTETLLAMGRDPGHKQHKYIRQHLSSLRR